MPTASGGQNAYRSTGPPQLLVLLLLYPEFMKYHEYINMHHLGFLGFPPIWAQNAKISEAVAAGNFPGGPRGLRNEGGGDATPPPLRPPPPLRVRVQALPKVGTRSLEMHVTKGVPQRVLFCGEGYRDVAVRIASRVLRKCMHVCM